MLPQVQQNANDFLARKRLALVGLSRNPKDFSRYMYNELRQRGYDVVPVNPNLAELDGTRCFARLQDVSPPVEGALVMTAADRSERVVHDCAEAGINRVWLHRGTGQGAVSPAAVSFCQEHGMRVVAGYCPFMFLPKASWFHRVHAFFRKLGRA